MSLPPVLPFPLSGISVIPCVCCSALQCVAVRCSVLQCVANPDFRPFLACFFCQLPFCPSSFQAPSPPSRPGHAHTHTHTLSLSPSLSLTHTHRHTHTHAHTRRDTHTLTHTLTHTHAYTHIHTNRYTLPCMARTKSQHHLYQVDILKSHGQLA